MVYFSFSAEAPVCVEAAAYTGEAGSGKVPLGYRLLPEFAANRLQGLLSVTLPVSRHAAAKKTARPARMPPARANTAFRFSASHSASGVPLRQRPLFCAGLQHRRMPDHRIGIPGHPGAGASGAPDRTSARMGGRRRSLSFP